MKRGGIFHIKFLFCLLFVLSTFGFARTFAYTKADVISPVAGVWANCQSLVLDLPSGAEAFYSLSEEDPAVSGFAYDGPTLLNVSGNVHLMLLVVYEGGLSEKIDVRYTVTPQKTPDYIDLSESDAFVRIDASRFVDIPQTVSYTFGNSSSLFSGKRLILQRKTIFERFVPLVLYDGQVPFRYVLLCGGDDGVLNETQAQTQSGAADSILEFYDWNYFSFKSSVPVEYRIDDQNLRESRSERIYIQRGKDHVIYWRQKQSADPFTEVLVPAKPSVVGIPEAPAVNTAVRLSLSDPRFSFGYAAGGGKTRCASVCTIDTLDGDSFGFSRDIDIYYNGIKQGSMRPSFIIDKIPPSPPVITASDNCAYVRKSVLLNFSNTDTVYYCLKEPFSAAEGFTVQRIKELNSASVPLSSDDFVKLTSRDLVLESSDTHALFYTLHAYAQDVAGNRSETVVFQTVIDPLNYYVRGKANGSSLPVSSAKQSAFADGSPDRPFGDFSALFEVLKTTSAPFVRCIAEGVCTDIPPLFIEQDMEIRGNGKTRLIFEKDAFIKVKNCTFTLKDCTLEQNHRSSNGLYQNKLIEAENAVILLSGDELICKGSGSTSCISMRNSSLEITDSGVTVEALSYACSIHAEFSVLAAKNIRTVVLSETAVGMSANHSSVLLSASSFTLAAHLARALELSASGFTLMNNSFVSQNEMKGTGAVWSDGVLSASQARTASGNTYKGFASLFAGAGR
ncbi:MAG: hypothetical protein ACTTIU_07620 [Treponema lecithinolyticum]|uniref:hypothetical protein n=1 Tax=Treponema lecithinolyticum TaxID=53418 RepID=UPI003FA25EEF